MFALTAVALLVAGLDPPAAPAVGPEPPSPPRLHIDAASRVGNWIESTRIETEHGVAWPADPGRAEAVDRSLYHGTPGVILFMLELHRATEEQRWLDAARRGGDELLSWLGAGASTSDYGLWTGLAGQAWTLLALHDATGDARYRAGVERCLERLAAGVQPRGDGVTWNETTDVISGSAGIGLTLLDLAERLDDPAALELARRAGIGLLAEAIPAGEDDDGVVLEWPMTPGDARRMPNFSHGTAGVCYFLVQLAEALGTENASGPGPRILDGARAGARHLLSIADRTDGGCRIHHHAPGGEQLFYLGWCHGPAGTARLFDALGETTGDPAWRRWSDRGAASIRGSGIPEQRTAGFWNNVGRCCGSAGVASFFVERYRRDGRRDDLLFAQRLVEDIMSRATLRATAEGPGLCWIQAEHRVRPELLAIQTGSMQGAAGIGLVLLELDAAEHGGPAPRRVPGGP